MHQLYGRQLIYLFGLVEDCPHKYSSNTHNRQNVVGKILSYIPFQPYLAVKLLSHQLERNIVHTYWLVIFFFE